jgi:YVTN family beta-propeller protein
VALAGAALVGSSVSAYIYYHGSMAGARFAAAAVVMVALLLVAGSFAVRWHRAHSLRLWLLPPAWIFGAVSVLVAVDPMAKWASRPVGDGMTAGDYSFVSLGGHPVDIALTNDVVWVVDFDAHRLLRVDPRSEKVVGPPVPVGRSPAGMALVAGALWVVNRDDGTVSRIDPGTNRVAGTFKVGTRPQRVAVGAGFVWVTNMGDGTLSRIDAATNAVVGSPIKLGRTKESPCLLAASGSDVWVANYNGSLQHVRLRANAAVSQPSRLPAQPRPAPGEYVYTSSISTRLA